MAIVFFFLHIMPFRSTSPFLPTSYHTLVNLPPHLLLVSYLAFQKDCSETKEGNNLTQSLSPNNSYQRPLNLQNGNFFSGTTLVFPLCGKVTVDTYSNLLRPLHKKKNNNFPYMHLTSLVSPIPYVKWSRFLFLSFSPLTWLSHALSVPPSPLSSSAGSLLSG